MPLPPDWKRVLETGMQFTELRRSQAQRLAADLVATGQLARDQIGAAVDEIVEASKTRSEELRRVVRDEVDRQLSGFGFATKRDLGALERRLRALWPPSRATAAKEAAPRPAAKKPAVARKAAAKPAAKKSTAKKSTAKKSAAKKSTAKKPAAKKPAAKKPAAKKSAAKKSAAKRAR